MIQSYYRQFFTNGEIIDKNYCYRKDDTLFINLTNLNISSLSNTDIDFNADFFYQLGDNMLDITLSNSITKTNRTFEYTTLPLIIINPGNINQAIRMFAVVDRLVKIIDKNYTDKVEFTNLSDAEQMFYNTPNLNQTIPIYCPKLSYAPGMFIGSSLDYNIAETLLNSLPNYTSGNHPITIILKNPEGNVNNQLENIATSKGWTLTLS